MCRAPRLLAIATAVLVTACVIVLTEPGPPPAEANVACSVIGGAIGGGNPVGDACDSVVGSAVEVVTSPVKSALEGVGKGILGQITTWVSEGATWLIGEVVAEIDKTTTPRLTTEGFLSEYAKMAQVASILAAAMFLMALLEAVIQGSWAVLGKAIFVSVPLAFVGTSIAFVIVQMLLVVTDGMSHAVSVATQEHSSHFFKAAMGDLSIAGATAGGTAAESGQGPGARVAGEAAGATAVPLFVTCLMAIVGGLAAFCVWIEMVFRDAAVYAVVLFMPLAAAASISPRWTHILRRYVEVIVTVVGSKFVIVSVVALAASLIAEDGPSFEHILAASALLLVACFCPFVLFRLVLSTEAAVSAAFARRSAGGHVMNVVQMAGGPQSFANMARSNWSGPEVWSVSSDDGKDGGGGPGGSSGPGDPGIRPPGSGGGNAHGDGAPGVGGVPGSSGAAGSGGSGAAAAAGSSVAGVAVAGATVAAHAAQGTAHHLEQSGTARIGEEASGAASRPASQGGGGEDGDVREAPDREAPQRSVEGTTPRGPSEAPPRPPEEGASGSGGGGTDA